MATRRIALVGALAVLPACPVAVEPETDGLLSIDGYSEWQPPFHFYGNIPGHGESFRIVYVNPSGRDFVGSGRYPIGTVIVKEVRNLGRDADGTPAPGDIRYVAIMRKVGEDAVLDVPIDGGWVFTQLKSGSERHLPLCWDTCHRAAQVDGAFFDYGY